MSQNKKFNIQTESIKGTKFSIDFEIEANGRMILSKTNRARHWKFANQTYEKNHVIKELMFVLKFLQLNRIKMMRLSPSDLAEIISELLEIPGYRKSTLGGYYRQSHKVILYTHAIMDLYTTMKEI